MDVHIFIENFRKAFGESPELPIVFWYSGTPVHPTERTGGCLFKSIKDVRNGSSMLTIDAESTGCGGGKFYSGFTDMPERIPIFVSLKEKYKKTPELVTDFIEELNVPRSEFNYLNFCRIDLLENLDHAEGVVFFATPDILSGLASWTFFDSNAPDCISVPFGSGCSSVISQTVIENGKGGKRTFLGFFDPSARPYVEANILSFAIPMSRFKEMYYTLPECCLTDSPAWNKIRKRINGESPEDRQ